jgi:uncharacterized protein YndB with AHSA1/START domain
MNRYRVHSSRSIAAPPGKVYAVLADYRHHHRQILPPEYFRKLEVIAGGTGAGTRTRVEMRILGSKRVFEHVISEPEPGRILVESDVDGSNATTFTVEPADNGASTHLTISTELVARPGIYGALERKLGAVMLRRVYRKEMARLAEYVTRQRSA